MEGPNVERRLAAVLAADVLGYSRLMEVDEAGTLARLKTIRLELIDPAIAKCKGRIIKTTGDGMLVEFQSVTEALRCAVDFQERMARRNRDMPASRTLLYRIGINLGDVIVEGGDIFGDGVNVAARLESIAEPGGICISAAVRDQVGDRLDIGYEDVGEQHIKNINRAIRVFKALLTGPNCRCEQCSLRRAGSFPGERSEAVDRGSTVQQHERRFGAGVFLRWAD
jgi:adenylate cyclase